MRILLSLIPFLKVTTRMQCVSSIEKIKKKTANPEFKINEIRVIFLKKILRLVVIH